MRTIRTIIAFCFIGCLSAFAQRFPMAVETINPGLLGLNPNTINTNAWVLGLNSVTDGQGGWFTWWKNDTTATDTFNVFQPTWAGAPSGRWKRTPFYGSFSGSILTGPLILSDGSGAVSSNSVTAQITTSSNGLYSITLSSTNLTTLSGMLTNLYAGRTESQAYTITASNNIYTVILSSTNAFNLSTTLTNLYAGRTEMQQYANGTTNTLAPNLLSRSGSQSLYRYYNLSSSGLAQVSPYAWAYSGTANFGPNSGETFFQAIATNQSFRFRETGTVTQIKVYVGSTNGMTGLWAQHWHPVNGTNGDLGGTSSSLWPLVPNATNTFSNVTGMTNVLEMDYPGFKASFSSASVQNFFATNNAGQFGGTVTTNAGGGYYSTSDVGSTNVAWSTMTQTAISVPIQFYMTAPGVVFIGPSILGGTPDTGSGADEQSSKINPKTSMPTQVGQALGVSWQNMGQAGDRFNNNGRFTQRYTNDLAGMGAPLGVVLMADNDTRDGTSPVTTLTAFTNMVLTCTASNMSLVICEIMPSAGFSANLTAESNIVYINSVLDQFPNAFSNVQIVRDHDALGVYWTNGPDGNRMLLNPKWTLDGVHLNAAGKAEWARMIIAQITTFRIQGKTEDGGSLHHGEVRLAGDGVYGFGQDRAPIYGSASNTTIYASGAPLLSTNQNAGDLVLKSGTPTGTGTSGISIQPPLPNGSGTSDGTNVETARFSATSSAYRFDLKGTAGIVNGIFMGTNDSNGTLHYQNAIIEDTSGQIGFAPRSSSSSVDLGIDTTGVPFAYPKFYIGGGSAVEQLTIVNGGGLPDYVRIGATGTNSGLFFVDGSTFEYGIEYIQINGVLGFVTAKNTPKAWMDGTGSFNIPSIMNSITFSNNVTVAGTIGVGKLGLSTAANEAAVFDLGGGLMRLRLNTVGTNSQISAYDNGTYKGSVGYDNLRGFGLFGAGSGASASLWVDASGNTWNQGNFVGLGTAAFASQLSATGAINAVGTTADITAGRRLQGSDLYVTNTIQFQGLTGLEFIWPRLTSGSGYRSKMEFDGTDKSSQLILADRDNLGIDINARKQLWLMGNGEGENSAGNGVYIGSPTNAGTGYHTNAVILQSWTPDYKSTNYGSLQINTNLTVNGSATVGSLNSLGTIFGTNVSFNTVTNLGGRYNGITNIGANYTVASTDQRIICTNTGLITVTLPQWYAYPIPVEQEIEIFKPGLNTNGITFAVPTGGTNSLNLTLGNVTMTNGPLWIKFYLQGGSTNAWYHTTLQAAGQQ